MVQITWSINKICSQEAFWKSYIKVGTDLNFCAVNCSKVSKISLILNIWAAPSEFGTYRLCKQRRFRRACACAQSCQNLRCSLIQAVSQEEPSDRKPDPWPLWMAGHAQLKCVMTECSKTQIRLMGLIICKWTFLYWWQASVKDIWATSWENLF